MKALIVAEAANPEWASVPLVGWSLATAIREQVPAHIVTQVRNREAFIRAGLREGEDFTAIDSEALLAPVWKVANAIKGGQGVGWTTLTAAMSLAYPYFEHLIWKRFGAALRAGGYSLVHRVTPLTPTAPSLLSRRCAQAGVPFVLGPLNGGVPWPAGYDESRRREKEWLSYVRGAYRWLPGVQSTYRHASLVIAASDFTLGDLPGAYRSRYCHLPENAVDPRRFHLQAQPYTGGPLRVCFVGRLVPYKGADMLLESCAHWIREGRVLVDIVGDGPDRAKLESIVQERHLGTGVTFHGWLPHDRVQEVLSQAQVLGFPSIREFGGGVVLEAMALGVIPLVVDYGGPGELVDDTVGFKVPMLPRRQLIELLRAQMRSIMNSRFEELARLSAACRRRVAEHFTWEAKARKVVSLYETVLSGKPVQPMAVHHAHVELADGGFQSPGGRLPSLG